MSRLVVKFLVIVMVIAVFVDLKIGFAQETPVLKDVQVKSGIIFDLSKQRYHYIYTLINPLTNTGQISSFTVDILKPKDGKDFSPDGLVIQKGKNFDGEMVTTSFSKEVGRLSGVLNKPVIPVGVNAPKNWDAGISIIGAISWGSDGEPFRIMPGQSLGGFEIITEGLPGIRPLEIKPFFILTVEGNVTKEDIEKDKVIGGQIILHGKTIGPTAPPAKFIPLDFLTHLIDLRNQAQVIGWIGGPKFALELDKELNEVKTKLAANEIEAARVKLGSFIEKLEVRFKETKEQVEKVKESKKEGKESEEKKFITSEGYALLKFNAEYLKDQLGKPKEAEEKKHEDKKEEPKR